MSVRTLRACVLHKGTVLTLAIISYPFFDDHELQQLSGRFIGYLYSLGYVREQRAWIEEVETPARRVDDSQITRGYN